MSNKFMVQNGRKNHGAVSLTALTLGTSTWSEGVATGAVLATISGKTSGSTISTADGRFTISGDGAQLLRGLSAWTPGATTVALLETLGGATNSPRTSTVAGTIEAEASGTLVTLNSADKATNATLSDGDLSVMSSNGSSSTGATARSTMAAPPGRRFFQAVIAATTGGFDDMIVGLMDDATGNFNFGNPAGKACGWWYSDGVFSGNMTVTEFDGLPDEPVGTVISVALDNFTTGEEQVWFRIGDDADWNNDPTADPVAGIGGIDVSGWSAYFAMGSVNSSTTNKLTFRFSSSEWTGEVPTTYVGFGEEYVSVLYIGGTRDTTAIPGVQYSWTPASGGGTAPRTYAFATTPPAGVSLNTSTGEVTFTEADSGTSYAIPDIIVTDAVLATATLTGWTVYVNDGAVLTASTTAGLLTHLATVTGGETINLLPGEYDYVSVANKTPSSEVVIQSIDPDDPAVIRGLLTDNCTHLTWRDLDFSVLGEDNECHTKMANGGNNKLDGCRIYGENERSGAGFRIFDSTNDTVVDCTITNVTTGGTVQGTTDCMVQNNTFKLLSSDGIRFTGDNTGSTADGNKFTNFRLANGVTHIDAISFPTESAVQTNCTVTNNIYVRGDGTVQYYTQSVPGGAYDQGPFYAPPAVQFIFLTAPGAGTTTVTGNRALGGHDWGVAVHSQETVICSNNFIQGYGDTFLPHIDVHNCDSVTANDNQTTEYYAFYDNIAESFSNNAIISNRAAPWPTLEEYLAEIG